MGRIERFDVAVVGGGAIGITCALQLAAQGCSVAVFEAASFAKGTSHGNAGLLCPSYCTPIASPQSLLAALGWLARREGPFSLAVPPWDPAMARWLALFVAACRPDRVRRTTALLADMARRSIEWYAGLGEFAFARDGWLYVYRTRRGFASGLAHARAVADAGVSWRAYPGDEAAELEPLLRRPAGGVYYPGDAHLDPHAYLTVAVERAREAGVVMHEGARVDAIRPHASAVEVVTANGAFEATHVVLAAGAWTPKLASSFGVTLPVQPARGTSLSLLLERPPRTPLMLGESHIVVTPMGNVVRATSALELGSFATALDVARLSAMTAGVAEFLTGATPAYADAWVGFRPLTPDGLPIVGALSRQPRIIVATGHGTLGMTLAPATAALVCSLVAGQPSPVELSPRRFGG